VVVLVTCIKVLRVVNGQRISHQWLTTAFWQDQAHRGFNRMWMVTFNIAAQSVRDCRKFLPSALCAERRIQPIFGNPV